MNVKRATMTAIQMPTASTLLVPTAASVNLATQEVALAVNVGILVPCSAIRTTYKGESVQFICDHMETRH